MQSRDKLSSTDKLKLGNSNVRLHSICQFFFFFCESDLVRSFSPSNLIASLNSIEFDWFRLQKVRLGKSGFQATLLVRTGVALHYEINPVFLSHFRLFRLCSHYLSQVGSMYNAEEYFFDSTLVWNCMGISFNRFGLNRLGFDMKLFRVRVTIKRITFIHILGCAFIIYMHCWFLEQAG